MVRSGAVRTLVKRFGITTPLAYREETIRYVKNRNKVPKSEGTRPLMQLPVSFPDDVDYNVYLVAAEKLLCEVGYF